MSAKIKPTEEILNKLAEYHNQVIEVKSTETLIRELNIDTAKQTISDRAKRVRASK